MAIILSQANGNGDCSCCGICPSSDIASVQVVLSGIVPCFLGVCRQGSDLIPSFQLVSFSPNGVFELPKTGVNSFVLTTAIPWSAARYNDVYCQDAYYIESGFQSVEASCADGVWTIYSRGSGGTFKGSGPALGVTNEWVSCIGRVGSNCDSMGGTATVTW